MLIDSKFSNIFYSKDLTDSKYNEIVKLAREIRNIKNDVSNLICQNPMIFINMSKFDFQAYFRSLNYSIGSNFYKQIADDVFVAYDNKFDSIIKKIKFDLPTITSTYYKRNSGINKKGQFKSYSIKRKSSQLSTCLTYLARYGNENIIEYINNKLEADDKQDKVNFYKNILRCIDKFGFDRLNDLALQKRNRVLKRMSNPIVFKQLSFRARSRKKKIVDYNSNYNSKINAFVELSWLERGQTLYIPTTFAKSYHKDMKSYIKSSADYEYTMIVDELNKSVKVVYTIDGQRKKPIVTPNDKVIGIDVNMRSSMFYLSDNTFYKHNQKLINEYSNLLKLTDKQDVIGKKKQIALKRYDLAVISYNQEVISNLCKHLKDNGIRHIVMEDLDNGFGKSFIKDNDTDINFNRLLKITKLSSLKDIVKRIANKNDIAISFIHKEYTSKQCNKCKCIDDNNRKQEVFKCVECGFTCHADLNASLNIKNRVTETVFHDILSKNNDGTFNPKILKRDFIKDKLLSHRELDNLNNYHNPQ